MSDPRRTYFNNATHVGLVAEKFVSKKQDQTAKAESHPIKSFFMTGLHIIAGLVVVLIGWGVVPFLAEHGAPWWGLAIACGVIGYVACYAISPNWAGNLLALGIAKYKDIRGIPVAPSAPEPPKEG
jgi:hypothetical protein